MKKYYFKFKSSVTGLFVSAAYAILHPRETYRILTRRHK